MLKTDDRLLSVRNLSARIGRQDVLTDVSLDVERSECVAIVGGSGAGKSCLLRCLMGLYDPARPYRGDMTFGQETYDFSSPKLKKRDQSGFAFVPQNPQVGLDPLKRLAFQWRQSLRCAAGSACSIEEQKALLKALDLEDFKRSFPRHWSQGMQQRLLIAFALLSKPDLLVLDEPTSALDPIIAAKTISKVMNHARERGISVLIVTHDLALANRFAHRVAIMSKGHILECGQTDHLMSAPSSDYGKLLVANRSWTARAEQGGHAITVSNNTLRGIYAVD